MTVGLDNSDNAYQFMQCMYCFKQFDTESINVLANHITDKYTFCKYFCRYCLYRAYTASHVLIHEYVFHKDQKPSILKLKNLRGERKEVVKAIDFKKFVLPYVCNIGCCTFSSYINSDFLSHLRLEHVHCDRLSCDLCAKNNDEGFISFNPKLFVKHFNLHCINTYQCIFCLFGAECMNVMIIHLAMEHFEYEPLCLERCPKNDFCDGNTIKNLKILNIKKYVSDEIIEIVSTTSLKNADGIRECPTKEINELCPMDPVDRCTNTKPDDIDNTPQLLSKIFKKIAQSTRNTSTPAIDNNKNNMIILSDEDKRTVPGDAEQIQNVKALIVNDKKNPPQLSNYELINDFKLEKDTEIQINGKCLEHLSNESVDEVFLDGLSYEDHLNNCPVEGPKECTFCLAQSKSTFEVVEVPKLLRPNRFTCTFCNLELPSSDIVKNHVKEEHHISNLEFVPVDINATDIEKDKFLVCQDKSSRTKKRSNDCIVLTDSSESTIVLQKKRSKVVNKQDDSQLTIFPDTLHTSEKFTRPNRVESKQQHKILKRKHSTESYEDNNRKIPSQYKSNDLGVTIAMYFSPDNINNIPRTEYFLQPMGCLLCEYETKVRSKLVSHIKKHRVKPDESTKKISKSIPCNSKSIFTSMNMTNLSTSSFKAQENEKVIERFYDYPQFVSKRKRFKCSIFRCDFIGLNIEILKSHILKYHPNFWCYICPHCKPIPTRVVGIREMRLHLNYHGEDLYICQYCSYFHYKREKIEAHQKRKHPSQMNGKKKLNVIAIRRQTPIKKIAEWICKLCTLGVKYTLTEMAKHLLTVHKISNMFKCSICLYNHSDYEVFKKHFKLNHPSLPVKHLNVHFDKVSPDVEPQPSNKQTHFDEHVSSTQNNTLNVLEELDSVAEPTTSISKFKEIPIKSTTTCSISTKSIDVSQVQEKILSNPSEKSDDYLALIQSTAKFVCPVCNVYITKEEQSFRKHLLIEINCKLWKCLECFMISDSVDKIKSHVIKHRLEKQKYEKIDSLNKNIWIDRIIDYQNILIEYVLLRKNNQHTDFDDQNGANSQNGNDQSK
ncbi:uncharacterized protein LOC113557562 [Rhopalosiphum maidis]|uniref:uncharacterized protein LOC113557562 n=1 Tax=Rhopalosiphum maidis TaxID=43146 RepID=UPI000EFEEA37|nr:uncharacterized protein LOC113557562 [Rhopalosiphum maidis]